MSEIDDLKQRVAALEQAILHLKLSYDPGYSNRGTRWIHQNRIGPSSLIYDDGTNVRLGGASNYTQVTSAGELSLAGTATVFNDANVGALTLITGGTMPGIVEWLDNLGNRTSVYTRAFAAAEQVSGSIEIPHDYKEGSNITFHVHWGVNVAPTGTDNVKWQLDYTVTRGETTFAPSTIAYIETPLDTQYELKRSDFPAIVGTNFKIGDQFDFTLSRIQANGDGFTGEALVETIGFHYECDTMGSKTITAK